MKPVSFREVRRRLLAVGFYEAAQSGSHLKFIKVIDAGTRVVMVPKHREVAGGTIRSILKQAGLSEKEFSVL